MPSQHHGKGGHLLQVFPPNRGQGAKTAQEENSELPGGVRRTAMACYWVLSVPQQRGYHQTRRCIYFPAPLHGRAAGGWRLQYLPDGARG